MRGRTGMTGCRGDGASELHPTLWEVVQGWVVGRGSNGPEDHQEPLLSHRVGTISAQPRGGVSDGEGCRGAVPDLALG